MSQYQPNAAPGKSFISKINSKFQKMGISSHVEKDGSTEDDTLIHHAFVRFFDSKGQPYPDWLGVKNAAPTSQRPDYLNSEYQPVRSSYNQPPSSNPGRYQSQNSFTPQDPTPVSLQAGTDGTSPVRPGAYTRRSNSKLQAMYQKSRQTAPGGRYTSEQPQVATGNPSGQQPRGNAAGLRLRERMMNGPNTSRPTWGKQ